MAEAPRVQIQISEDGLEAVARVRFGPPGSLADVHAALAAAEVTEGIDESACRALGEALSSETYSDEELVLASGTPADPGRDGELRLDFDPDLQPGRMREDDSVDFLDREFLNPVREGERVAVYVSPTDGEPGLTVDGKAIEVSPGKETLPKLGDGVVLGDGGAILAATSGAVQYRRGELMDVVLHHEHGADVDVRSGHLKMEGSVSVRRSIRPNFMVRATEDVEVSGTVDAGRVYAGRDIRVAGGIIGGEEGKLEAGGCITARHLQGARLYADGKIRVHQHSVGSDLHGAEVAVEGRMLGGAANAETLLVVGDAGSDMGIGTELVAGKPVERPSDRARRKLRAAREPRGRRRGGVRQESPKSQPKGGKWARECIRDQRSSIEHHRAIKARQRELLSGARVEITGVAHQGLTVCFADQRRSIEVDLRAVRFVFDVERREICMEKIRS